MVSSDPARFDQAFPNIDPRIKNRGLNIMSVKIESPTNLGIFRSFKVYLAMADGSNEVLIASNPGIIPNAGTSVSLNINRKAMTDKAPQTARIDPNLTIETILSRQPGISVTPSGGISIRGAGGPPLFVLDGSERTSLQGLQTSDIQSINVLKDASETSMYGVRGANGIIVIKTKAKAAAGNQGGYLESFEKGSEIIVRLEYLLRNSLSSDAAVSVNISFK